MDRDLEVALIDTPEVQRLRGIKQLGAAYLVYPGAMHSRFEHSLGTSWLARRMLDEVARQQGTKVLPEERRILSAAALLHDVSHVPFGHTLEDERHVFSRHDEPDRVRAMLERGALGKQLARLGLKEPVLRLLTVKRDPGDAAHGFLRALISGTVCADLLDYLARDTYFCGLSGGYDHRLLRSLRRDEHGLYLDAQKDGIVRHDVISEVVNLLRLRYFLSERVYYHHTKVAAGAMISRAVECAIGEGLTLDALNHLADDSLLAILEQRHAANPTVARLLSALRAHGIYKRAYVVTRRVGEQRQEALVAAYHLDRARREEAEQALQRRCRLKPGELVIYCPALGMALKEARVRVRVDQGAPRVLADLALPEIEVLQERHRDLWRLYVFVAPHLHDKMRSIAASCEAWFQEANHLPTLESGQLYF